MKKSKVLGGRDVDSKWSWVVCLASFLIQFVVLGIQNSFGAFFIEFLKEFKHGESATAWIGSVSFGLTFMNGPLATALCSRWGSRPITCLGAFMSFSGLMLTSFVRSFPLLYLTYGVIFGLGASFSYFASIAGLTSYFKKRLSLAYGITLAGSGAGTPVMIVFLEYLIKRWGWRVTFQFTAAVVISVFIGGLTYLPINPSKPTNQSNKDVSPRKEKLRVTSRAYSLLRSLVRIFDPKPFKDRAFAVWVVALGFCIFGYFIPFVFVIRMAKDIGVSSTNSTLLIAYLAITQTVCKIVFGRLGDFARERRISILQAILFLQAIVTMLCPLASKYGYIVLVIYVVVFGLSDGCWSVMVGMGTELIVGKAMMPRAFGSLYGLISIPLILGPPIAGVIYDKYGSYDAAFILAGSTVIFGIGLMQVVQRLIRGRSEKIRCPEIKILTEKASRESMIGEPDNVDTEYLMPVCRQNSAELYSRPSSLIISRVLEDMQWNEDANIPMDVENFITLADMDTGCKVTYRLKEQTDKQQETATEDRLSIFSDRSSFVQREREESMNSDSGRSTFYDGSESLTSQRSRTCSADSFFEADSVPTHGVKHSSKELLTDKQSFPKKNDLNNFYCSFSDDIFSDLMERALEAEFELKSKVTDSNSIVEDDLQTQHEPSCFSQVIRETIV